MFIPLFVTGYGLSNVLRKVDVLECVTTERYDRREIILRKSERRSKAIAKVPGKQRQKHHEVDNLKLNLRRSPQTIKSGGKDALNKRTKI